MTEARNSSNISKILLGTDLSSRAERAIARGAQLAEQHGAALTILHVLTATAGDKDRHRQVALQAEKELRRKVAKLDPHQTKSISVQVATGTPFVEIIRRAREESVDIVLVGAHGAQFIRDLLFGTTAEKIVRKGDRPVLIVKRPARGPYRRVLATTDFSDPSRQALELGLRLAPGAKFDLLHAYRGIEEQLWRAGFAKSEIVRYRHGSAKESREQMELFIRNVGLGGKPIARLLRYGRAPHVINEVARRLRPDLVCVGSVGRTGLPHILLGSVAEHVLREVSCDVLVARSASLTFQLP
jgi:nucleotide-binding universal stress UspA family protein